MSDSSRPLALRPRDAARALSISERKLWALSQPRGPIPCKRLGGKGGVVLYRVEDLDAFLCSQDDDSQEGGDE